MVAQPTLAPGTDHLIRRKLSQSCHPDRSAA